MKTSIMDKPLKLHRVAYGLVCFLMFFSLFSCTRVPLKGVSPQSPQQPPEVKASTVTEDSLDKEQTTLSSSPGTELDEEWMELSWEDTDDSPDAQKGETDGDELALSGMIQISSAAEGEEGKTDEGAGQDDPNIEVKNGQAPNGEKEQESSDQARLYDAIDFLQKAQELWKQGNLEEAKGSLDHAYQSILEVKAHGDPEIVQQVDDLRFLISKRILEIYASRFNGVQGNHNEIPLVMNDHVRAEIKRFQTEERDFFLESYARSGRYRPLILEKLEETGLPLDLSWLPLIESGFKVRALSRSRALGLWQFIPSTGYKFGLKRNQWIDERMDVEKSTDAAILYLKELHEIFGDWTTVLAAYNCGEGTVLRRIRGQTVNYLDDFWDLYEKLPRETARYVPRYLAVLHIIKNSEQYGFKLDGSEPPIAHEKVEVPKRVRLRDVGKQIGVSETDLVELNPELRYKATPVGYGLKVPQGKAEVFLANLDKIPRYKPPKRQYVYHRVRRGETLSQIARRYRTSVRSIANANGIIQQNFIRVGQKLKIPVR
jgi:membrane-bound lytic murein transglycosylase D